MSEVKTNTTQM